MLKDLVKKYTENVWNRKDVNYILEAFHSEAIIHSLLGHYRGPAAMQKVVKTWISAFPDLHVTDISYIHQGDTVVVQWEAQGTHLGEFKGIKSTGKTVAYKGASIYRFDNDKVVEYWGYLDMQHLLNQIQ